MFMRRACTPPHYLHAHGAIVHCRGVWKPRKGILLSVGHGKATNAAKVILPSRIIGKARRVEPPRDLFGH